MTTPETEPDGPGVDAGQPRSWFLSAGELAATRAKLAKLNARAERKGFTGRVLLDATPATRSHTPAPGAPPVTVHGYQVQITGDPPVYAGWRFLAAVDTIGDQTLVRYPPGADPAVANDDLRPGECDHCHARRPRTTTVLVINDHTGELLQVGRSCLRDFLGWSTTPVWLTTDQVADQLDLQHTTGTNPEWDLRSVLTYAWAAVSVHGWTPASTTGPATPTRDVVATMIRGGPDAETLLQGAEPYLLQGAQMVPIILDTLGDHLTAPDGYQANLRAILKAGKLDPAPHLGLAVSAVPTYLRLAEAEDADRDRHARAATLDYAAPVGEKVTLSGIVTTAMNIAGFDWRSPNRRLLVVDCGTSIVKTITTAAWAYPVQRGDPLTLTGTVKAHTDYRGVPQTVLARPRRTDTDSQPPLTAAAAAPAWEALNPAPGKARPFPGPPHPLATSTHPPVAI